jgi:hypothetical protein
MNCPKCCHECERDSVDIGVGIIYGPWGCGGCGWSEDPRFDSSEGVSSAQVERPEWLVDSRGGMIRREAVEAKMERFGIPAELLGE